MNHSATTDEELAFSARHAVEGDLAAFDELVKRHQSRVTANCRYMTRSPEDAEDLAQEVFVKAYFGLRTFEGRSLFRTWLQRIKINHCLNFVQRRAGKTFVNLEDSDVSDAPELAIEPGVERELTARGDRERIEAVLDSLPDTLRVPLVMRELDELAYEEIADTLGLGLSAVKMRIKRGREEFRRRFGAEEPHGTASHATVPPHVSSRAAGGKP